MRKTVRIIFSYSRLFAPVNGNVNQFVKATMRVISNRRMFIVYINHRLHQNEEAARMAFDSMAENSNNQDDQALLTCNAQNRIAFTEYCQKR